MIVIYTVHNNIKLTLMSTTPYPLKLSADEAFEGPLYLQHWFNTLEKADENGKTHVCKECQARVKWRGK